MAKKIAVVGYPRSGNTWMSWLLGDAYNSSVGGYKNARPLATEGQERTGMHPVMQLHLRPVYEDVGEVLPNAYGLCVPRYEGNPQIVYVVRDPRDVAVSAAHYWKMRDVEEAVEAMGKGLEPLKAQKAWQVNTARWLDCPVPKVLVRYEDLHEYGIAELLRVLDELGNKYNEDRIEEVWERQSFATKRAQIKVDGSGRMYGKTIQLHHMRKGVPGSWKETFSPELVKKARDYFGEVANRYGYDL